MKKNDLINPELSRCIASLGHTDTLVVADAGLPISSETQRIDLALTHGIPTLIDTLRVILEEMYVEKAYVSEDVLVKNPHIYQAIQFQLKDVPIEAIPHKTFKEMTRTARAVVRTGEFTPFANVILVSGAWGFDL
jgi:D-ribose pyranase